MISFFKVRWSTDCTNGRTRHYSRKFDTQAAAVEFYEAKRVSGKAYDIDVYRVDVTEKRPAYTDPNGIWHAPSEAWVITAIAKTY